MSQQNKSALVNPYVVLAHIDPTERDTTLHQRLASAPDTQPVSAASHRRETPPAEPDNALALPRGALVAVRRSGGLAFSSRELVIYRDGRVVQRSSGVGRPAKEQTTQRLPDEQVVELLDVLRDAEFPRFGGAAHQSPDTYTTEIAARVGRRVKTAEVGQHSVPAGLAALVGWLGQHLEKRDDVGQ